MVASLCLVANNCFANYVYIYIYIYIYTLSPVIWNFNKTKLRNQFCSTRIRVFKTTANTTYISTEEKCCSP
jgi:hypothetical protein